MSALEYVDPDDPELVLRSLDTVQDNEVGNYLEIRVGRGDDSHLVELVSTPIGWCEEGAVAPRGEGIRSIPSAEHARRGRRWAGDQLASSEL